MAIVNDNFPPSHRLTHAHLVQKDTSVIANFVFYGQLFREAALHLEGVTLSINRYTIYSIQRVVRAEPFSNTAIIAFGSQQQRIGFKLTYL